MNFDELFIDCALAEIHAYAVTFRALRLVNNAVTVAVK
jgi:hypothetical protein